MQPDFFGFDDGLHESQFISEFTSNLSRSRIEYSDYSKYEQFIFNMFGENNYDVARELSKEEIQEFYNLVIEAVREQTVLIL